MGQPTVSAARAKPGHQGTGAEDALRVGRHVRAEADHERADAQSDEVATRERALTEHPQRQDGLGRSALHEDEPDGQDDTRREDEQARNGSPAPRHPALEQAKDDQGGTAREQRRPDVVNLVGALRHLLLEAPGEHPGGDGAERQVDEEDPAPREVLREDAAEGGPDHGGGAPDAGDVPLHARTLFDGVEIADHRDAHGLYGSGTDALQRAEDDERRHAPGEAAQHRAQKEHGDPEEHHRLAPENVGELAVEGDGHRLGEQVDREKPGELGEPAQVADDGRHRRRDDRAVECHQAGAEHDGGKHRTTLRPETDAFRGLVVVTWGDSPCRLGVNTNARTHPVGNVVVQRVRNHFSVFSIPTWEDSQEPWRFADMESGDGPSRPPQNHRRQRLPKTDGSYAIINRLSGPTLTVTGADPVPTRST